MHNNRSVVTTRDGTTINATFSRYINNIKSRIFVSQFSYHKRIITIIKDDNNDENNSTFEET